MNVNLIPTNHITSNCYMEGLSVSGSENDEDNWLMMMLLNPPPGWAKVLTPPKCLLSCSSLASLAQFSSVNVQKYAAQCSKLLCIFYCNVVERVPMSGCLSPVYLHFYISQILNTFYISWILSFTYLKSYLLPVRIVGACGAINGYDIRRTRQGLILQKLYQADAKERKLRCAEFKLSSSLKLLPNYRSVYVWIPKNNQQFIHITTYI